MQVIDDDFEQEVSQLVSRMLSHKGELTLRVVYQKDSDYEKYARQIVQLQSQLRDAKQEVYRFSITAAELLQALDDLHEGQRLLRSMGVEWHPQSLKAH